MNLFGQEKIFVFGSNLAGRHGRGSAKEALDNWGAVYGQGSGLQGRSYAIATKGFRLEILPLNTIEEHIKEFVVFAHEHQQYEFHVVKIGCGLAGYKEEEIIPLFRQHNPLPNNIVLPEGW